MSEKAGAKSPEPSPGPRYVQYDSNKESIYLPAIRQLISRDLSEPYSIYVYRYFLYHWGDLCFMVCLDSAVTLTIRLTNRKALDANENLVGVVISKLEPHRGGPLRGYIAMLAVREEHRGSGIATKLVRMSIDLMIEREADEVPTDPQPLGSGVFAEAHRSPSRPKSPTLQQ